MGTNDGYDTEVVGLRSRVSELEEALSQVKQDLRVGEHRCHGLRMDALARFAQSVSDELGEVVLSLSTQTQELSSCAGRQDAGRNGGIERPLAQLQDTVRRLGDLGRRVGVIGGSCVAQVELVGLNDVVERFVALVRGALPKEIEVDFIPGHELSSVTADPGLLDQVLLNLCLNSRDALPRGGRITVETENVLVDGKYRESHPWAKPGRYVLLTVSDDGAGMPREIRDRAFEPFFTTKAPGAGVGLGLATVYGIVQLHRGLVHLYTEVGRGTTVKIYLPGVERRA